MNMPNNKRRQETRKRIERTFVQLLQTNTLEEISVTQLCRLAEINRTTFYANYTDIYDLVDAVGKSLEEEVLELYPHEQPGSAAPDFLRLYQHIYENQIFYRTYFQLGLDTKVDISSYLKRQSIENYLQDTVQSTDLDRTLAYRIEFFRAGLNAVLKKWLAEGCKETPEMILEIIQQEYRPRSFDAAEAAKKNL